MVLLVVNFNPHLDKLAKTGSRFDSCITPNLVCQPSRASILTGQLPFTHGVCDNGIDLNPEIAQLGFAEQLNKVGYKTSFIGKAHFATSSTFEPTGTPECKHSSTKFGSEWYGPYMGFKHVELMTLVIGIKKKGLHFHLKVNILNVLYLKKLVDQRFLIFGINQLNQVMVPLKLGIHLYL